MLTVGLLDMIKRHEGVRRIAYQDPLGVQTIGVGHNLSKPLTDQAISQILQDDVQDAHNECLHAFPWFADLTEPRQWVMIDLCFNLGLPRLLGFRKVLQAMALGEYETAANELLDSLWAKQVKSRALELAAMLRGGDSI